MRLRNFSAWPKGEKILLAHGSGGKLMHDLIKDMILPKFSNPLLNQLNDSAVIDFKDKQLAFTTDSFVVSPLFFRGGDIGKLAVFGTVNDLTMSGAIPLYLSLALIIEEGLDFSLLKRVVDSLSLACRDAGVKVVAGDLKVVEKGACDKLFINTAGIGKTVRNLKIKNIKAGDKIIITGGIAEHGLSILSQRRGVDLGLNIKSDCASLNHLLIPLLQKNKAVKFMRDPTRGGLATTLNEIAEGANLGIIINEDKVPLASRIKAASELLGIDPLYIANEGKAILIVEPGLAEGVLRYLKQRPQGKAAGIIGEVTSKTRGKVILKTAVGTNRILDMLTSEPLPRIC
ncbi:MAG: hydrogenase expression/formation protein HypE [Candidatus Omnitrophota bacterium]